MELKNVKSEGELYSDSVRAELGLASYLRVIVFAGFAWALVGAVVAAIASEPEVTSITEQIAFYGIVMGFGAVWGFARLIIAGLIGYPLYKFWCSRMRGQRLQGKFAVVVPLEP
ncbi:hypothetical protein [Marinimicrobium sp. ABcell2]|uniref:hypothetical protein n=1 Tax=Marinimicrobium sp. ABcell2 TaxID=3069751 RepID=UPI0027B66DD1|nr:hypothetical protein [Marinimicrobium sp. ABcell2]MDQ2077126.1 hypothetical protein [Marinimicrobium sp. ABcell2]